MSGISIVVVHINGISRISSIVKCYGWNRYMKLSKKFEISKVNFWINLLIYNGIDLVSN